MLSLMHMGWCAQVGGCHSFTSVYVKSITNQMNAIQ